MLGSEALLLPPRKCTEGSNRAQGVDIGTQIKFTVLYEQRTGHMLLILGLPLTPMPGYLEHFCSHASWTTHESPMAREGSSQASSILQHSAFHNLEMRFSLPMKTFCYNIFLDVGIIYLDFTIRFYCFSHNPNNFIIQRVQTSFETINALNIFKTCSLCELY